MLNRIMQVLNEQEEIEEKIAKQVPVIARKSTREKPQKRKRTGFLGLFGKKEEAKPTATTPFGCKDRCKFLIIELVVEEAEHLVGQKSRRLLFAE